jgi:hypothetical protein
MAEGIFAVALLLSSTELDGKRGENAMAFFSNNGGILIAFRPRGLFVVTKGHDATLGPNGGAEFVAFDGLNTHGGEDGNVGVLREPYRLSDAVEGLLFQ